MKNSGVAKYLVGTATVKTFFPVDEKGVAHINCEQCRFYRMASRKCALNGELCEFPAKYIGSRCPLEIGEDNENI